MNEHLLVTTFGELSFGIGGETVSGFSSRKAEALLVYLAVERNVVHRRESLFTLLWPGMPENSARNNLRQVLFSLRKAIPEVAAIDPDGDPVPMLLADRQTVQVNPDAAVEVDIHQFDQLLDETQVHDHLNLASCEDCVQTLERVVALYQGNFLTNFYLEDSSEFEDWSEANREAYRGKALGTLEKLAEITIQTGDYEGASRYAEGQLKIDPLREGAYRQLMELYSKSGQRTEALRTYQRCTRILDIELGTTPSRETTALYEIISGEDLQQAAATPREGSIRGCQIREHIGSGHTGMVYRAFQPVINRDVAVKVIAPQFANHPDFIRRFEVEAQLVARLEHPYIVPLYDYWRDPSGAYLVMRWLKGGSLQDDLTRGPWMPEPAVQLIDQISAALSFAHRQEVVHCDIKPANILLDEEGSAYLSDFGIAILTGPLAQLSRYGDRGEDGSSSGSLGYSSPEVAQGQETTPLADIYSLGVVLFELLTASHPFPGMEGEALIQKHLTEPLPSVLNLRAELPAPVDEVIQTATQKNPSQRYQDVDALAQAFRLAISPETGTRPAMPAALLEARNPYKGLRSFEEADSADFFGRDDLVGRLLDKLAPLDDITGGERFLAVVGPSGSGKSSVVKAGLIPAVRNGNIPGSERWFVVEMTPGSHPLEELETALLRIAIQTPEDLLEQLGSDPRGLLRVLRKALPGVDDEVLLVIDQFEELFTLVEDGTERNQFMEMLAVAVSDPHSPLRVALTLRADFYDRPLQHSDFGELVREATEVVLPLNPVELERAICGPAEGVAASPEAALVARIVQEVGDQPGTLPLLQYALTETFEHRQNHQLTLAAYEASGGVLGALGRRAEEIYGRLTPEQQSATRQLFLRLVTLGEGTEDVRRRVLRSELTTLRSGLQPEASIQQPLEAFGRYRLLTFDHDPATRAPTVEVAHEALLREWTRLRGWLDESRDDVRMQRLLAAAAREWEANGREHSYLLRGTRLVQFFQWMDESNVAFSLDEQTFLDASLVARREREAEEAERQAHEKRLEKRSRRFLWALVGVFAIAAVIAAILSGVAFNQSGIAQENAATATYSQGEALMLAAAEATSAADAREQQAIAEEQSEARATQQAIAEAEVIARTTAQAEAEIAKVDALRQASIGLASQAIQELAGLSPERAVPLALEALENYPYTWQAERALSQTVLESRVRLKIPGEADYYHHDMSPDGTKLLSGRIDGTISVYEFPGGKELFRLTEGEPRAASWSPDGNKILSVSTDTFQLWDASGHKLMEGESDARFRRVTWFPWSPQGDQFVLGEGDGTARVIDAQTGESNLVLEGDQIALKTAAWSPSGTHIITVDVDGKIFLWDAASGTKIKTISVPPDPIYGANFINWSPSGRFLAFGADNLHIYEVSSGRELFTADGNVFWGAGWSPDEEILVATTMLGGEARAWSTENWELLGTIPDLTQGFGIKWSPTGDLVAIGGGDGFIRVWDPRKDRTLLKLFGMSYEPKAIYWSSEGDRIIATGTATPSILVFDLTAAELLIQGPAGVATVTWSHDGSQMARTYQDGSVIIYDSVTGDQLLNLDTGGEYAQWPRWTSDGRRIVTPNGDGQIKIWDGQTGALQMTLLEENFIYLFSSSLSPDGELLANTDFYGSINIWNISTGELIRTFEGHPEGSMMSAWSPDGTRIASTGIMSDTGKAFIWDAETGEIILDLYQDSSTWTAGVAWSHDGSRVVVFDGDQFGHIYDTQTGEELVQMCCQDSALQITWSPSDKRIIAVGGDGTGRVWEAETGVELIVYDVGGFASGAYSPDGTKVLLATGDGTTRIYPTWHSAKELINYAKECCVVRNLTPEEREQFGLPEKE